MCWTMGKQVRRAGLRAGRFVEACSCRHLSKKGMSSISDSMSLTTSSSGSGRSRKGICRQSDEESGIPVVGVGRIPMDTVTEVREDLLEEIKKSS